MDPGSAVGGSAHPGWNSDQQSHRQSDPYRVRTEFSLAESASRICNQRASPAVSTRRQHGLGFVDGVVEQSSSDRLQHCLCHGLGRGCRRGISQQQPTVQRTCRSLCRADPSDPSASATALLVFRGLSRSAIRTAGSPRGTDPSLQSGDHGDGTQSQR